MPQKEFETPRELQKIVESFQKKTEFLKAIKFLNQNPTRELSDQKKMHIKFAEISQKQFSLPLPLLLKIQKGILFIPGSYVISQGVAKALGESLASLNYEQESFDYSNDSETEDGKIKIYKLILSRNKMTDQNFESILLGLRQKQELKTISTSLNTIGKRSGAQLADLLKNETAKNEKKQLMPNIRELRIENCIQDNQGMDIIIDAILLSQIQKLSLQKMQLSDFQIKKIINFISSSVYLIDLDLSWNKFSPSLLSNLFNVLQNNTQIQNLSLAWVQMGSSQELLDTQFSKFCLFIANNSKLTHLNLTSINLPQKNLRELVLNIKRSQSLHCVHLCGNKFDLETMEVLGQKLKPTYIDEMSQKKEKNDSFKLDLLSKIQKLITERNSQNSSKIYDSVKIKELMAQWQSIRVQYQNSKKDDPYFKPFILSKVLAHNEIKNSKHWKISNQCYMCDRWKYSFIFWDLNNSGKSQQIKNPLLEEQLEELIKNSNERFSLLVKTKNLIPAGQRSSEELGSKAFITGTFTDWQPRRMMLIDELIALLDGKSDVLKNKKTREVHHEQIKNEWRYILNDISPYGSVKEGGTQWIDTPDNESFNRKNPPELYFNQLFVYVDFIKPGKHSYIVSYENCIKSSQAQDSVPSSIKTSKKNLSKFQYPRNSNANKPEIIQTPILTPKISEVKLSSFHEFLGYPNIQHYNLNIKINEFDAVTRSFKKGKSVFKDWNDDNEKKIAEALSDEIKFWAVPNIVKEESEQQEILKILQKHCLFLKTFFIIHSSASYFPLIRYLYFGDMVKSWDIFNDKFNKLEVDNIFLRITKNMPDELVGKMPEKDMSRFQFYEALVRIAFVRYKSLGVTHTTSEGFRMLVEDVLMKKYDNGVWGIFREKKLWCLQVDDLYKGNLSSMKKLYTYYFDVRKTKTMYLQDAIDLFTREIGLDLVPEQVQSLWGLSHMTVHNDIKQRDKYTVLQFCEFLELFARIADLVIKEHGNLQEKIEKLMDLMFPLIKAKRIEVNIEQEYNSVSEEELNEDKYFLP